MNRSTTNCPLSLIDHDNQSVSIVVDESRLTGMAAVLEPFLLRIQNRIASHDGDRRSYNKLIPDALVLTESLIDTHVLRRLELMTEGASMTVVASLAGHRIPWELLRLGDQFFCERFAMGRTLPDADGKRFGPRSMAVHVLTAHAPDLPGTNLEETIVTRRLRRMSQQWPGQLESPQSNVLRLTHRSFLDAIEIAGCVHFSGHAEVVDGVRHLKLCSSFVRRETSATTASDYISPADLQTVNVLPRFVFLNACGAVQLPVSVGGGALPENLVEQFLDRGTEWLLGPATAIIDGQTRFFTTAFYDQLAAAMSIGESVRLARLQARDKLGEYSLLPFSYVLYGDPNGRPFLASGPLASSTNIAVTENPIPVEFPVHCDSCGTAIETRHGIGRRDPRSTGSGSTVICYACHRHERRGPMRDSGSTAHLSVTPHCGDSADSRAVQRLPPVTAQLPATEAICTRETGNVDDAIPDKIHIPRNPELREFMEFIDECVHRPITLRDVSNGQCCECRLQPVASEESTPQQAKLADIDRAQASVASADHVRQYFVTDTSGERHGLVSIVACGFNERETTIPDSIESVTETLTKLGNTAPDLHHFLFLCTDDGLSESLVERLTCDAAATDRPVQATVYLHTRCDGQTRFRPSDLAAWSLCHLFQRTSTRRQFLRAFDWLQGQLPLPVSLSSPELATRLALEIDAVETAMRCVAYQHGLELDQTRDFGVVLSEPSIQRPTDREIDTHIVATPSLWQWLTGLLNRS